MTRKNFNLMTEDDYDNIRDYFIKHPKFHKKFIGREGKTIAGMEFWYDGILYEREVDFRFGQVPSREIIISLTMRFGLCIYWAEGMNDLPQDVLLSNPDFSDILAFHLPLLQSL